MILQGVLDRSLGNFICLRGYAPLGELYRISEPEESYQRDLIASHQVEMEKFLNDAEFLFFPEVILGTGLDNGRDTAMESIVQNFYAQLNDGNNYKQNFSQFSLGYSVTSRKKSRNSRDSVYYFRAHLDIKDKVIDSNDFNKFHRIREQ